MVVLNAAPNGENVIRCGFVAGKKVGGAVERNRARRLIREAVRARLAHIKGGWDLVWIARTAIVGVKLDAVAKDVESVLVRSRLLMAGASETGSPESRIIREGSEPAPRPVKIPSASQPEAPNPEK